jgi:hypothetical protein
LAGAVAYRVVAALKKKVMLQKRVYALPLANRLKLAVTQGLRIYRDSMA